jgi:hypothetical protein
MQQVARVLDLNQNNARQRTGRWKGKDVIGNDVEQEWRRMSRRRGRRKSRKQRGERREEDEEGS